MSESSRIPVIRRIAIAVIALLSVSLPLSASAESTYAPGDPYTYISAQEPGQHNIYFHDGGGGGGFAPAPTTTVAESEEEKKKKLAAEEEEKRKKADEEKLALEKAEKEKAAATAKEKEDLAKAAQNAAPTPAPTTPSVQKNSVPTPRATAAAKAEVLKILAPNSTGMLALAKPAPTLASAVVAKSTSRDTLQVAIKPPTIKSGEKISAYQVVITSATGKKKTVTLKGSSAGAVDIKGLTSTAPYTLEISAVVNGKSKIVAKTKMTLATKKKK